MKIAVISNVNIDPVIRVLKKTVDVFQNEGYGNELGMLLNETSSLNMYRPDGVFVLTDLMELIGHTCIIDLARKKIDQWFEIFESCIKENILYYLSTTYLRSNELNVLVDYSIRYQIENYWMMKIVNLTKTRNNIRIFPLRELIEEIGCTNAFSGQMWYMGKIPYSVQLQNKIVKQILDCVRIEMMTPKKVLLLDLDNTLWGGLAGESDSTPLKLSDDHMGLIYKDLQRVILEMKKQGVLLGIVSKNNEEDALEIIRNHPHMILKETDFAIKKINWKTKDVNIREIAEQLNLGLDAMVFFDDNPSERELVSAALPEVTVCNFPRNIIDLPRTMVDIWKKYFVKSYLTTEDYQKTMQYSAQTRRKEYEHSVKDFSDYLEGLQIKLIRKNAFDYEGRILQLLNKTNQFNLTTRRYTQIDLHNDLHDNKKKFFVYQVIDKFGDEGIIAVVIVDLKGKNPVISDFVMSCRVMGKNIENAIMDHIEKELISDGYEYLEAWYNETAKNKPVKDFYERLDYKKIKEVQSKKLYEMKLSSNNVRNYFVEYSDERVN